MAIQKKKKPCIDCGKLSYTKRCNYCTNAIKIKKSKEAKKKTTKPLAKKSKTKKAAPKKSTTNTVANLKINILKKHTDDIFSLAIRLRDSNEYGYGKCITCNAICFFYSGFGESEKHKCFIQNGHFRSRAKLATRFDWQNNHGQCSGCNGRGGGKPFEYGLEIDKKYGEGTSIQIHEKSLTTVKMGRIEYIDIILESISVSEEHLAQKSFSADLKSHIQGKIDFYKKYLNKIGVKV